MTIPMKKQWHKVIYEGLFLGLCKKDIVWIQNEWHIHIVTHQYYAQWLNQIWSRWIPCDEQDVICMESIKGSQVSSCLGLWGRAMMDHDLERIIKEKNSTYGLKIGSWWAHMLSHGWSFLEASNSCEDFVVPLKRLWWSMKKNKWWPIWYSWIKSIWSYDN